MGTQDTWAPVHLDMQGSCEQRPVSMQAHGYVGTPGRRAHKHIGTYITWPHRRVTIQGTKVRRTPKRCYLADSKAL